MAYSFGQMSLCLGIRYNGAAATSRYRLWVLGAAPYARRADPGQEFVLRSFPLPARPMGPLATRLEPIRRFLASEQRAGVLPMLVWAGLLVGIVLVAWAYAYASIVFNTQLQYHVF